MNTFSTVLLIIITSLLILDVYFLTKLDKRIKKKKKIFLDQRYFELKTQINLIKAVSGIVLFVGTYLGVSTLNEIKESFKNDFMVKVDSQKKQVDSLISVVKDYTKLIDKLKIIESQGIENLSDINNEFKIVKNSLERNKNSMKHFPQMFIIKGIKIKNSVTKVYFRDLKTIDGKKLPNFNMPPAVNIQCYNAQAQILDITKDYFELSDSFVTWNKNEEDSGNEICDVWILYKKTN